VTLDSAALRSALSHYPTGVAVVAVAADGGVRAMTVGSFASVSLEPPLGLFCVAKRARLAEVVSVGRPFSVNVLRSDQRALSTYFAGAWREKMPPPHRFVPWADVARLEGAAVSLAGRVATVVGDDAGDHLIVIGRVNAVHRGLAPIEPLVFFDRRYHTVDGGRGEAAPELDPAETSAQVFHETW
jgi:flavin reductase (DIM6/NTAB) family NADH-FMN oxidoreductase RutF